MLNQDLEKFLDIIVQFIQVEVKKQTGFKDVKKILDQYEKAAEKFANKERFSESLNIINEGLRVLGDSLLAFKGSITPEDIFKTRAKFNALADEYQALDAERNLRNLFRKDWNLETLLNSFYQFGNASRSYLIMASSYVRFAILEEGNGDVFDHGKAKAKEAVQKAAAIFSYLGELLVESKKRLNEHMEAITDSVSSEILIEKFQRFSNLMGGVARFSTENLVGATMVQQNRFTESAQVPPAQA